MDIINKITLLLEQEGKSQKDLTDFLCVSRGIFSQWKNGNNSSYMKYLPRIARFFNVSVDYILGNEQNEIHSSSELTQAAISCILNRILTIMSEKNVTQKDLCDYIGINKQAFTNWKNGDNTSYMKHLPEIAHYLDVSVDYLVSGDKKEAHPQLSERALEMLQHADDNLLSIIELMPRLPKERQQALIEIAQAWKKEDNK